jgi:myosin-7
MEQEEVLRTQKERELLEKKRQLVHEVERRRDEPVDDSQLVEQMFDFLPDSASETQVPPTAFKVSV